MGLSTNIKVSVSFGLHANEQLVVRVGGPRNKQFVVGERSIELSMVGQPPIKLLVVGEPPIRLSVVGELTAHRTIVRRLSVAGIARYIVGKRVVQLLPVGERIVFRWPGTRLFLVLSLVGYIQYIFLDKRLGCIR